MAFTSTATVFRYGSARFGNTPYGGLSPRTVIPTRNVSGIIFLTSNDRYQVVSCSYGGTLDTPPEFRYWYAAPPAWAEQLNNDGYIPPWYSADEDTTIPVGSLELPYRRLKAPQEMLVEGVIIEFVPRPASLSTDVVASSTTCGFTVFVEGQGIPDYARANAGMSSGVVQSDVETFSELASVQPDNPWPNIRTIHLPTRIQQRCNAARVVIQNIKLVEILAVQLVGSTNIPGRAR